MFSAPRVHTMVLGNTMNTDRDFLNHLHSRVKLHEVFSKKDCDVIIAFVPIVSRAGTDIQAALENIPNHPCVILVVLHHTFDPESIVPDSRYSVRRKGVFAVDCLYHEDQGFLKSRVNDEALQRVITHLGGENPSYQVSNNTELKVLGLMLVFFLLYLFWPEVFSFYFFLLVSGISLIIIVASFLGCFSLSMWMVCVLTVIIIGSFVIVLTTKHQDTGLY